jgi:acetolactate synthase-1/2/3 large subunit
MLRRQLPGELSRRKVDKTGRLKEWHAGIAKWRAEWEAYIRPNFEIHASPGRAASTAA